MKTTQYKTISIRYGSIIIVGNTNKPRK